MKTKLFGNGIFNAYQIDYKLSAAGSAQDLFLRNLEKCVRQDNIVDAIHSRICFKLWINVKEYLQGLLSTSGQS